MKIVKVPDEDRAGVISYGSPPQVELEIEVIPRKGEIVLRISNPNLAKVEITNEVELYEYVGFWQKLNLGLVFLEKRIVLIPGETVEQRIPVELTPGEYRVVKFAYVKGARVRVEKEFTLR
ncbi:immunoglobulin-like domain-containing protein [Thermococcus waiotapuensis]|uniref:Immunoglobulin-like domain-containing protein n=1 Tax=Thermococcus waiotapuensis TaxID=90909 RepID=A0AAE4NXF5_9EURY|nr:immunoglobulin-like domain-containing protein [Thermococcus waiotapuensis]MDV3104477.1 immunoglobulin-like domain-containing protein [Thermococcus waiotapuensis]